MTIKTKFDIDDKVYFLHRNKIYQGKIAVINFSSTKFKDARISYYVTHEIISSNMFFENELFSTREELIKSL